MGRHGRPSSVIRRRGVPGDALALSQNFLRSPALVRQLVADMRLPRDMLVLDIGAGRGIITSALADAGHRVVALEKDPRLHRGLRARFSARTNVVCHHADALAYEMPREPYAVVSNVPFSITSALMRHMLDGRHPPEHAWLIVQREAAVKFAGEPRETMFSLLHKPHFSFEIARTLSRDDFVPVPRVDVALLHVERRKQPLVPRRSIHAYERFVREGLSGPPDVRRALREYFTRRQLMILSRDLRFDLRAPPSALTFGQWLAMFRFHAHACRGPTGMDAECWRGRCRRQDALRLIVAER